MPTSKTPLDTDWIPISPITWAIQDTDHAIGLIEIDVVFTVVCNGDSAGEEFYV